LLFGNRFTNDVIPAKAGIQSPNAAILALDSGFRRNDDAGRLPV
jgi:hypothetical protein